MSKRDCLTIEDANNVTKHQQKLFELKALRIFPDLENKINTKKREKVIDKNIILKNSSIENICKMELRSDSKSNKDKEKIEVNLGILKCKPCGMKIPFMQTYENLDSKFLYVSCIKCIANNKIKTNPNINQNCNVKIECAQCLNFIENVFFSEEIIDYIKNNIQLCNMCAKSSMKNIVD